jgi:hypothetical protein
MWAIWRAPEARVTQDFNHSFQISHQMSLIKLSFSQFPLAYQNKDDLKNVFFACSLLGKQWMD